MHTEFRRFLGVVEIQLGVYRTATKRRQETGRAVVQSVTRLSDPGTTPTGVDVLLVRGEGRERERTVVLSDVCAKRNSRLC